MNAPSERYFVNVDTRRNLAEAVNKFNKSCGPDDLNEVGAALAKIYSEILEKNCMITVKILK